MFTPSTQIPIHRAQPVGFICFRQRHLLVVSHQSTLHFEITEYIEAKPLVASTRFSWEAAQTLLKREEVASLCGTEELLPPDIATEISGNPPENPRLYLRLEGVQMFLARLSTDGIHEEIDQGAVTDSLILQNQWIHALRAHQRHAMAMRLWQRAGIDEVIYPQSKPPRAKPRMFKELEMIQALGEHGTLHNPHKHPIYPCQRHRNHSHGDF